MWGLARQGCGPYGQAPMQGEKKLTCFRGPGTKQGIGLTSWARLWHFQGAAGHGRHGKEGEKFLSQLRMCGTILCGKRRSTAQPMDTFGRVTMAWFHIPKAAAQCFPVWCWCRWSRGSTGLGTEQGPPLGSGTEQSPRHQVMLQDG